MGYQCRRPVKRRRALLGSNPSRNSRLETHSDGQGADRNWPAPATRRLPTNIGVDLPIPKKPTPDHALVAGLAMVIPLRNGIQAAAITLDRVRCLRPAPRRQRGAALAPSTGDPALRGCSAVAAGQHAPAADAPRRRPAVL